MTPRPHSSCTRIGNVDLLAVAVRLVSLAALFSLAGLPGGPTAVLAEEAPKGLSPQQEQELHAYFGFGPLEVFKIEFGIDQLRAADFNNDGRNDLAVTNNGKSTIEILLQRSEEPDAPEKPQEVNDLVNDWRFERKSISLVWAANSMQAAEVTGDDNADVVFFGDPAELVVFPGKGDGTFDEPVTRRVRDGLNLPGALDVGDLNGDGRTDIALLAENDVVVFLQPESGGVGQAKRFAHAIQGPLVLQIKDLNGDGADDLAILTQEEETPLQVRFQDAHGNLGPAQRIRIPALRSLTFASCLGRKNTDLLGVERVSGRLKRWVLGGAGEAGAEEDWAVLFHPLPGQSDEERFPVAVGDVDGDHRPDLVTAEIDAAEMVLFRQQQGLGLLPPERFGGQRKMRDMRCFDADSDGADEVYVLSADEESIARSVYRDKRLAFPEPFKITGKPYALDVGRLTADDKACLGYVSRNDSSQYSLVIQPAGSTTPEDGEVASYPIEGLDEPPSALRMVDVNRDGRTDVLVFVPYAALRTFLQTSEGRFERLNEAGGGQQGLVKDANVQGFAYADVDGDGSSEVLLAQKTFVRALYVNEQGDWQILDQYNAPLSDAEIIGVCAVGTTKGSRPRLAMYDRRAREVHLLNPVDGGRFELDRSVLVGTFDLKAMYSAPLAGDDQASVLLADNRKVALVLPGRPAAKAHEVAVYESSIKEPRLGDLAVGDLNHDGRTDVAVIEQSEHFIEVLTFGPDDSLVRGNKFRVFAKKQYRGMDRGVGEPRWITIADVTSDGRDDLILLAHDRILLYPGQ